MPDKSDMGTMDKGNKTGAGGKMPMHEQMQADMKAMDDELDVLVVKMSQAYGIDKMGAMAAVITKMAQQRKMMDQKTATMQGAMMQGMMSGTKMSPPADKPMNMGMPTTMPQGK
jgi:hypothetical protein